MAALDDEDNDGKDTDESEVLVVVVDLSVLVLSDAPSAVAGLSACSSSVASSSAGKCPAVMVGMIVALF